MRKVHISFLSKTTEKPHVREVFERCGEITKVDLIFKDTFQTGYGFVTFATHEGVREFRAMHRDRVMINNCSAKISISKPNPTITNIALMSGLFDIDYKPTPLFFDLVDAAVQEITEASQGPMMYVQDPTTGQVYQMTEEAYKKHTEAYQQQQFQMQQAVMQQQAGAQQQQLAMQQQQMINPPTMPQQPSMPQQQPQHPGFPPQHPGNVPQMSMAPPSQPRMPQQPSLQMGAPQRPEEPNVSPMKMEPSRDVDRTKRSRHQSSRPKRETVSGSPQINKPERSHGRRSRFKPY